MCQIYDVPLFKGDLCINYNKKFISVLLQRRIIFIVNEFTMDCIVLHYNTDTTNYECFHCGMNNWQGHVERLPHAGSKHQARGVPRNAGDTQRFGHAVGPKRNGFVRTHDEWVQRQDPIIIESSIKTPGSSVLRF